ncbi:MAG TPA: VOC family protein [Candidatus Ozemobacteraceae bacterium]
MIDVTPLGILTEQPESSRQFYRTVLGIERVQTCTLPPADGAGPQALLRLESPQIEVFSSETRLLERTTNAVIGVEHRLLLKPRDPQGLIARLESAGIALTDRHGASAAFEDLNGIRWELRGLPN